MTGHTHKQFAVAAAFLTSALLYKEGLTNINYYLTVPILVTTAEYGALFPDVDHDWSNVHSKTVPNWFINKAIHLTNGHHRSWQTHSIDIVLLMCLATWFLPGVLLGSGFLTPINCEVLSLIMWGFTVGWVSHIFSDMLTSAGVRLTCLSKKKVVLVPKHIGKLKFNTGNEWEGFVFKVMRILNIILGVGVLVYPWILNPTVQTNLQALISKLGA